VLECALEVTAPCAIERELLEVVVERVGERLLIRSGDTPV